MSEEVKKAPAKKAATPKAAAKPVAEKKAPAKTAAPKAAAKPVAEKAVAPKAATKSVAPKTVEVKNAVVMSDKVDAPKATAKPVANVANVAGAAKKGEKIKSKGTPATGRRKKSVARVRLIAGSGKITVNGRSLNEYFANGFLQLIVNQPLTLAEVKDVDVIVNVHGGGLTGQAGAIRHGISRALVKDMPQIKTEVKKAGYLKRDPRMKERKKYGLKKARRAPQFSKR